MVTVPVLTMTVVISMVTITIIGLYFIWRRRRGRKGNAPETIHTSNNS
jgi:heme/copper-type cytochrome/quinol oxidase subunit 2